MLMMITITQIQNKADDQNAQLGRERTKPESLQLWREVNLNV